MALQQNETVSITLKIEGDEARNKLMLLERDAKSLEKALKEAPKGSEEWARLNKEFNANTAAQNKLRNEIGLTGLTVKQLEVELRKATKEWKNTTSNTEDYIVAAKRLDEVKARLALMQNEAKGLSNALDAPQKQGIWGKMVGGVNTVKVAMNAFLALQIVQWLYDMGKSVFDITSKFEKYDKVLVTALGGQKEATQSMAAIKKMAAETSFGVDELTEGYVKMVNRGLRPSQKEMTSMADLAASQGKTFDQLTEAALDAMSGENERLKEFGISAKKSGDQTTFSFKGMQQTVANTPEALTGAIIAFGEMEGVAGQNAKMMETLGGRTSNLGDSFDELMVEMGNGLRPVFIAILDLIQKSIPALSFLGKALASVALVAKSFVVGLIDTVSNAGKAIWSLGEAAVELTKGNLSGAKSALDAANTYGKASLNSLAESGKKTNAEIIAVWKNPNAVEEAKFAGKKQGEAHQKELTDAQKKEADKRIKEKEKELKGYKDAEEKYDKQVATDRAKALELIAQLENEHEATVAKNASAADTSKIEEKRRKRLKEINDSLADETVKETTRVAINRNADAEIERIKTEHAAKVLKQEQETAAKRIETARFITETTRQAELSLLDWREMEAKGNASKLANIAKERVNLELKYQQEKLTQELAAEKQKATTEITDTDQREAAILALEKRYHQESITADTAAAGEKKKIDDDLRQKKQDNLKAYSESFSALLKGDIAGFAAGMSQIVQGHKTAWQERLSADMANYEQGAQAAQAAVNFLNNLAQKKAEKAIAEANRERDEKVAILTNELAVTDSLIKSSSEYVTALKSAETDRLAELQRILTSETSSEEQKRDALKRYYSDQLQQMKAAEEQKIQDLQRMANLAKTEDEKRAIEAKMEMARQESAEKIRVAEAEMQAKKTNIDELNIFTSEVSADALADAQANSEKQINIATDEAEKKADFKIELEETIAAENRKARATEMAEKQKAFRAQKKADIATALITGALAVLKALANFFPLNIILAATAAVVTGVQIAKIKNQPEPTFAYGGLPGAVIQGGKHGARYSDGGIALIDRASGREVGEMEGGEAIISADQTEANMPLINEMFKNARSPGMRKKAIALEPGLKSFRDGGTLFESPYWQKDMYLFGSKKRKAEQAAKDAEAEAAKAQAEADAYTADMPSADTSAFDGIDGSNPEISSAEGQAAYEASQKQGAEQIKILTGIAENTAATVEEVQRMATEVSQLKGSINNVHSAVSENVGATRGVENAVRESNANGVLHAIMGKISALAA